MNTRDFLAETNPRLVTLGQIATRAGAKPDTVQHWTEVHASFPFPVLFISDLKDKGIRVWLAEEIVAWLETTGRDGYVENWRSKR